MNRFIFILGFFLLISSFSNAQLDDKDSASIFYDDFESRLECPKIFNKFSLAVWDQYKGNPIIEPSSEGLDDKSIRGFSPMVDANGYLVVEDGNYIGYYFAFSYDAPEARIFRTVSNGLDRTDWSEGELVLDQGSNGEWDETTVATGNVIKLGENDYIMDYVGKRGSAYGIGIATSQDGINWNKYENNPVLVEDQFFGSSGYETIVISIPYMIKLSNGDFALGLEGIDSVGGTNYEIFFAESSDGFNWEPIDSGMPVIMPQYGDSGSWENAHVANPKLIEIKPGKYLVGYNGGNTQWQLALGFATSSDLINWERYEMNPVLIGSNSFDNRRLEDPTLVKDDLDSDKIGMYYFGCNDACNSAGSKTGALIEYATSNQNILCSSTRKPGGSERIIITDNEEVTSTVSNSGTFSWSPSFKPSGHDSVVINRNPKGIRVDFSIYFINPSHGTFSILDSEGNEQISLKFSETGNDRNLMSKNSNGQWVETGFTYGLYEWNDIGVYYGSGNDVFSLYFNDGVVQNLDFATPPGRIDRINFNGDTGIKNFFVDDIKVRKFKNLLEPNFSEVEREDGQKEEENVVRKEKAQKNPSLFSKGLTGLFTFIFNFRF
jgi:predicted GH43/DUF377 family glycosyl hydrolase